MRQIIGLRLGRGVAGALAVERNVIEGRFDPATNWRLPVATDHDLQVIVFCSEGYTSSLAAAALQDLGLWRASDVVGGFHAWRAMGLPIVPPILQVFDLYVTVGCVDGERRASAI